MWPYLPFVQHASPGEIICSLKLYMSNWDVRGFTLETNMDNLENSSKNLMMDTEPVTGDHLADTEKVKLQKKGWSSEYFQMVRWYARAYGLRDQAYHEAYNRELHRQARNII